MAAAWRQRGGRVAAAWRQRGGRVAAAWRQTAGRLRSGSNTAQQHTGVVVGVCVWWSQPLWLSSRDSLPPNPNHFLTFTRPNTHATHLPPPLHPISCRHGHHRAVSIRGLACWPTTGWTTGWRQRGGRVAAARRQRGGRQLFGSLAARTLPTNTQGWWWCVCGGLSLCGSPHHTHSRQIPTISSLSRARIRTPHTCHHRCIPFHAVMATTGQCQTRAWHAGRPQGGPQGGGSVAVEWRQRGGSVAADSWSAPKRREHCPPTHWGGGGVCVVVSASVALLTTLTPANSQPFPHIHAPEYARHRQATTVASHFMPTWPPQGSV